MLTEARRHRARGVLTPEGLLTDATVVVAADGTVVEVRPATSGDPAPLDGWLLPGLVNAHLHLEFSGQDLVPGGDGFMGWGKRLMASRRPPDPASELDAAAAMRRAGTAGVFDISNGGHTASTLAEAGLRGVVQHELLGWSHKEDLGARRAAAAAPVKAGPVATRPGPHAVYSTSPELLQASLAPRDGVPASLHLGEDEGEVLLVRDGAGPFAEWLQGLGIPASDLAVFGKGQGLVAYLDGLGALHDQVMLVHGVQLDRDEQRLLADRGVSLCLCPRSNLHILDQLPDLVGLVEAGVPLALGTDSLTSSPDLDVMGEVALLVEAAPQISPLTWLQAATAGGSRALHRPDVGRIAPGARPGLLLLEGVTRPTDLAVRPPVRWVESVEVP